MKVSARLVAASGLCIGLIATPVVAADRELPTTIAVAQSGVATAAASADGNETTTPNCLLPGQLRKFGGITTVTPRRAVHLDAAECAERGGEPIESTAAAD
jgi:hypothetical protein